MTLLEYREAFAEYVGVDVPKRFEFRVSLDTAVRTVLLRQIVLTVLEEEIADIERAKEAVEAKLGPLTLEEEDKILELIEANQAGESITGRRVPREEHKLSWLETCACRESLYPKWYEMGETHPYDGEDEYYRGWMSRVEVVGLTDRGTFRIRLPKGAVDWAATARAVREKLAIGDTIGERKFVSRRRPPTRSAKHLPVGGTPLKEVLLSADTLAWNEHSLIKRPYAVRVVVPQ